MRKNCCPGSVNGKRLYFELFGAALGIFHERAQFFEVCVVYLSGDYQADGGILGGVFQGLQQGGVLLQGARGFVDDQHSFRFRFVGYRNHRRVLPSGGGDAEGAYSLAVHLQHQVVAGVFGGGEGVVGGVGEVCVAYVYAYHRLVRAEGLSRQHQGVELQGGGAVLQQAYVLAVLFVLEVVDGGAPVYLHDEGGGGGFQVYGGLGLQFFGGDAFTRLQLYAQLRHAVFQGEVEGGGGGGQSGGGGGLVGVGGAVAQQVRDAPFLGVGGVDVSVPGIQLCPRYGTCFVGRRHVVGAGPGGVGFGPRHRVSVLPSALCQ